MILYHYCSVEKFLKILQSKCLWLTDLACTNDKLEIKFGIEALLKHFERITKKKPFEALINYITISNRVGYAFCMSENGDLLSQWRGYADFGKGVSIGFETDLLNIQKQYPWFNDTEPEPNFGIEKVIYDEDKIDDTIINSPIFVETIRNIPDYTNLTKKNVIDEYRNHYPDKDFSNHYSEVCRRISPIAFYVKNKSFEEECEWRIVRRHPYDKTYNPNPLFAEFITKSLDLNHFERNGVIVGYYKFDISKIKPIKGLFLGPKCILDKNELFYTLSQLGFPGINIEVSSSSLK